MSGEEIKIVNPEEALQNTKRRIDELAQAYDKKYPNSAILALAEKAKSEAVIWHQNQTEEVSSMPALQAFLYAMNIAEQSTGGIDAAVEVLHKQIEQQITKHQSSLEDLGKK